MNDDSFPDEGGSPKNNEPPQAEKSHHEDTLSEQKIQNEEDKKGDLREDTDKISEQSVSTGGGNHSRDNNCRERLYSI